MMRRRQTLMTMFACGLAICLMGVGCRRGFERCFGPYTINVLSNITINGSGGAGLPDGIELDPQNLEFSQQICEMPSTEYIDGMIQTALGAQLASHIQITQVGLDEVALTAQDGQTWDFIQSINVHYIPKPVDGVAQDPILLGGATAPAGGFDDELVITTAAGVNFLQLMQANDANPAEGCPSIRVSFEGTVPTEDITFDVAVSIRPCARITLR